MKKILNFLNIIWEGRDVAVTTISRSHQAVNGTSRARNKKLSGQILWSHRVDQFYLSTYTCRKKYYVHFKVVRIY